MPESKQVMKADGHDGEVMRVGSGGGAVIENDEVREQLDELIEKESRHWQPKK